MRTFQTEKEDPSGSPPLELTELIGSGNDRDCWRHPLDAALCVKVAKPHQERPQNEIDYHYWCHLEKRKIHSVHVPRVYGWVETDRGPGLVFDLIQEPDGTTSPQLLDAVQGGLITYEQAVGLTNDAFGWLVEHKVILADYGASNLLVRLGQDGSRHLVFVDGLGARNFSFQYWLRRHLGFKAASKARQFHRKTLRLLEAQRVAMEAAGQEAPVPAKQETSRSGLPS